METNPAPQSNSPSIQRTSASASAANALASVGISTTPKPGETTTEFWGIVLALALVVLMATLGSMPQSVAGFLTVIASISYAYLRVEAKNDHNTHFQNLLSLILAEIPPPPELPAALTQGGAPTKPNPVAGSSDSSPATGGNAGGADLRLLGMLAGLVVAVFLASCATLKAIQDSPGVQAAETAGISIGGTLATGSPAFSFLAPIVVNGLTALADGSNPTAVTGANVAADAALIRQTVAAAIPNSTGKTVANQIATAYVQAMATPGTPSTPTGANAVIGAIADGLTTAATLTSAP